MKYISKQLKIPKQNVLYPASIDELILWNKNMQGK